MDEIGCVNSSDEDNQSDYVFDFICQPCKADGKLLEAEGRCEDCDEFLCKNCFVCHTVPSITRNHVVTAIDNIQGSPKGKLDQCTVRCKKHTDEIIKYYCPSHLLLGCSACIIMEHKACETVYIPHVARDIVKNDEFISAKVSQKYLTESAQQLTSDVKTKIESAALRESNAIEKIRKFRKEIDTALDKAENEYIFQTEKKNSENVSNWKEIHQGCSKIEEDISEVFSKIKLLEEREQFCNLYIEFRKHQPTLNTIENTLRELSSGNEPINPSLLELKWDKSDITATVKKFYHTIENRDSELSELNFCKDIDVHTNTDTKACWVSGSIILLKEKLLVNDYSNQKLKLVDTIKNIVIEEFLLPAGSRNIAKTGENEVAAAIPSKQKIIFVCFDPKFKQNRVIDVNGECQGLFYFNNKLAVTFISPAKVGLMDMHGSSLQTFVTNENGDALLNEPLHIVGNTRDGLKYISNAAGGFVLCLDKDWKISAEYSDHNLLLPTGMVVDKHGMVYVCDWRSNTVHEITQTCKKKRIVLDKQSGINKPYAITFDEENCLFYVGMRDNNVIKVFRACYQSMR